MIMSKKTNKLFQLAISKNINNIIDINNRYKEYGYKLYLVDNSIKIIYNKSTYSVEVIKNKDEIYWCLKYHKENLAKTKITDDSFEIIIQTIYNNEKIYQKEGFYE